MNSSRFDDPRLSSSFVPVDEPFFLLTQHVLMSPFASYVLQILEIEKASLKEGYFKKQRHHFHLSVDFLRGYCSEYDLDLGGFR